jgi:hypothetical protein
MKHKDAPITFAHFMVDKTAIQYYQQLGPTEMYTDIIDMDDQDYHIVLNKVMNGRFDKPRDYPAQPDPNFVWDAEAEEWVDPRTELDLIDEKNRKRAVAQMSKSDLFIALRERQILSAEDAIKGAGGDIPDIMLPMMAMLDEDVQIAARIKLKGEHMMPRNHPLIVMSAMALGISDETLDEIYGIV